MSDTTSRAEHGRGVVGPPTPVEILRALIRFDTSNPPGQERACLEWVAELLAGAGIDSSIHARDPARPNLVARVAGTGDAPPLLLYGHVDVVPVSGQQWSHDPFGGDLVDGVVWGRGALDMKGGVAAMIDAVRVVAEGGGLDAGEVIVACVLGAMSKEVIVTVPVLVLLYDRTFVSGSFRAAVRLRWRFYAGLAASWLLVAWLLLDVKARGVGFSSVSAVKIVSLIEGSATARRNCCRTTDCKGPGTLPMQATGTRRTFGTSTPSGQSAGAFTGAAWASAADLPRASGWKKTCNCSPSARLASAPFRSAKTKTMTWPRNSERRCGSPN